MTDLNLNFFNETPEEAQEYSKKYKKFYDYICKKYGLCKNALCDTLHRGWISEFDFVISFSSSCENPSFEFAHKVMNHKWMTYPKFCLYTRASLQSDLRDIETCICDVIGEYKKSLIQSKIYKLEEDF